MAELPTALKIEKFTDPAFNDLDPNSDFRLDDALRNEVVKKYLDDCAVFRARLTTMFQRYMTLGPDQNWLMFTTDNQEIVEGVGETVTVVIMGTGLEDKSRKLPINDIRIISADSFPGSPDSYLTTDFALDEEYDAQYYVDFITVRDGKVVLESLETLDGNVSNGTTFSPVFNADGHGNLRLVNFFPQFSPLYNIVCDDLPNSPGAMPFGIYKNIGDSLHALSVGYELIEKVHALYPAYGGTTVTFN